MGIQACFSQGYSVRRNRTGWIRFTVHKNAMSHCLRTLLICCILAAIPLAAFAGIYKYRDSTGRLIFVDDEQKIPAHYRDEVTPLSEANDAIIVYDNAVIEASQPPAIEPEEAATSQDTASHKSHQTPVVINGNRVLVPVEVTLGNRSLQLSLLLDTGASTTVLHRESLEGLDLPSGKSYKARVAGGGIVKSKKIKFRKIAIGPFEIDKASAMVISLKDRRVPFDGMLGMDFLRSHPYRIDFKNEIITWEVVE